MAQVKKRYLAAGVIAATVGLMCIFNNLQNQYEQDSLELYDNLADYETHEDPAEQTADSLNTQAANFEIDAP